MKAKKFFIHCRKLSVEVIFHSLVLLVLIIPMFAGVSPARAAEGDVEWVRTMDTGDIEPALFNNIKTTSAPDGNVYLLGLTNGDLHGLDIVGMTDIFIRKYTPEGDELWTRMLGTTRIDIGQAIAADSTGIYIAGSTEGTFDGQANTSGHSALIGKYDPDGNQVWLNQLGDTAQTEAQALAVAGDRLYVAGFSYIAGGGTYKDIFVRAYNTLDGTQVWAQSLGTAEDDVVGGIAVAGDAVYVTGKTGWTMFLKKYSLDGVEGWSVSFQAENYLYDHTTGVGMYGALVYVAGYTAGALPGGIPVGIQDGFIKAFNLDGTEAWCRQFNATATSVIEVHSLAVDSTGVYLSGVTNQAFPGSTSMGGWDPFIRRYSLTGEEGWTLQFGTGDLDLQDGLSVDATGIYVSGRTDGEMDDQTSSGGQDAFLKKVALDGGSIWTKQFSADAYIPNYELANAVDAAGNVYIAGQIVDYTSIYPLALEKTLFIAKYSPAGVREWINEFQPQGDPSANPYRMARGVAVDTEGSVYVVGGVSGYLDGQTSSGYGDAYISKYDAGGNAVWTRQFGTEGSDGALAVTADSTGIYVAGFVNGLLGATYHGASDAFVRKYDLNGEVLWTNQFGSPGGESVSGIASDGTNLYVSGNTTSVLENQTAYGGGDGFVRKYTPDGDALWIRQFGSDVYDEATSVAADASGAYVAGYTFGTLPGQTKGLYADPFVLKYPPEGGDPIWIRQTGTDFNDYSQSVAISESGVYVGGFSITNENPYVDRALLQKFNLDGDLLWQNFFTDNSINNIYGVAIDDTGIYLSGFQTALNHSYNSDAALVKLSLEGDAAPTANPGGPYLGAVNTAIQFDGSLSSDPDGDPLTYAWTIGDGGTATDAMPTHSYATAGIYDVCLIVNDGSLDSVQACTMAVVYDPSAGFVTGGGWIDSPAGAYKADASLAGKATFGFVSKYQKGANVPTGNTAFEFDLAGMAFSSTSYEWLVVNQGGTNAQFKGSGLINGALDPNGNAYKFMLWAGDGSPDTFRIRIWWEDEAGEHDVYDNGTAQAIGAGNIVVHRGK